MSRRATSITLAAIVVVLVAGAVAAVAYDHARRTTLAPGVTVGGVEVGGLRLAAARERVHRQAVKPLDRTVQVKAAGHTYLLSAREARLSVDVDGALERALAVSRRGWIGARVVRGLAGSRTRRDFPLTPHVDGSRIAAFAREIDRRVEREPVSAKVTPHADGLEVTPSRDGRTLDVRNLRRHVRRALTHIGAAETFTAAVKPVAPKVTLDELKKQTPAYILVDRASHQLRLYEHLELAHTFPIAVGKAGLETPAGLYDVQWKETNPSWHVPNSDWAGDLAGKTIPPGPQDPIKARWLAFNGGAGIHGIDPSEYGTIGHDASHGCVRMRIPDVIVVYDAAPVGTPVFVA